VKHLLSAAYIAALRTQCQEKNWGFKKYNRQLFRGFQLLKPSKINRIKSHGTATNHVLSFPGQHPETSNQLVQAQCTIFTS
jgi:hypothetical protein